MTEKKIEITPTLLLNIFSNAMVTMGIIHFKEKSPF
jgi:hypothetical protein